jgi:hypothetical protein
LNFIYASIHANKIELNHLFIKENWEFLRDSVDVNLLNATSSINVTQIDKLLKDNFLELDNTIQIEMSNPILMFIIPLKFIR